MYVTLPFVYEITHQKPGKLKPSTSTVVDQVTADVPEVCRSEVSLAATWDVQINGRPAPTTVITRNGDLFMSSGISGVQLKSRNLGHLSENMRVIYGAPHWGSNEGKILLKSFGGGQSHQRPKEADITSTTLRRDQIEAQHMVEGLLVVDGEVWQRVPSLVVHFHQFRPTDACDLSIAPSPYGLGKASILRGMVGIQNPVITRYFGISEMDQALAHAVDSGVVRHFQKLVVHQPDFLDFDGQSEFAARIMNSAVRTHEYRVGVMGDHEISLWMQMRDAVARWYGIPTGSITEGDIEALHAFCSMTPKSHANDWPRRGCAILDSYRANAGTTSSPSASLPRP
jgi:hypothetical protein